MNTRVSSSPFGRALDGAERNKVLRNTYALLAVSMIPTVLGAWVGVSTGITAAMGGGLSLILFFAAAFGFIYAIAITGKWSGLPSTDGVPSRLHVAADGTNPNNGPVPTAHVASVETSV